MMSLLLRLTVGLVRIWTHVYTWRMDPTERDDRRAEIESDLWESLQDRASDSDAHLVARMLARLVLGIPDDLTWRATHVAFGGFVRFAMLTTSAVMVAGGLWIYGVLRAHELPQLPEPSRHLKWYSLPPPPPPLPPPPPPPPGYRGRR